jgi:hypothetical protein
MQIKPHLLLGPALFALPLSAQEPLSAIDWLEVQRNAPPITQVAPLPPQSPVAESAAVPDVDVQPLDAPSVGGVGLLPGSVTGLPSTLWRGSRDAELVAALDTLDTRKPSVPALESLLHTLLLAEADLSVASNGEAFLAKRLELLTDHGLVAPAEALAERVSELTPKLFAQAFDLALLTGSDAALCQMLDVTPSLSTDLPTRIWCATRSGDYPLAMTIYQTATALGQLSDLDAELLLRFLDPEYTESTTPLRPPVRPTPLQFRLFEAIGEALPTTPLPLPFAVVELSGDAGWRAQLQAAERLASAGAIDGNQLLGVYTDQTRAASGGIWDRVEALQRFETALSTGDPEAISSSLVKVWPQMRAGGLLVPFSDLFATRLQDVPLGDRARRLAGLSGLLSDSYEEVARDLSDAKDPVLRFLSAIARGEAPESTAADVPHANALRAAWETPPQAAQDLADLPGQNRLGEALLRTIRRFDTGASGNDKELVSALQTFRAFGLEDTARRAALQLAILDMEGARR